MIEDALQFDAATHQMTFLLSGFPTRNDDILVLDAPLSFLRVSKGLKTYSICNRKF